MWSNKRRSSPITKDERVALGGAAMSENSRQGQKTGGVGGAQQHEADDKLIAGKFTLQQVQNLRIIRAARRYNRDSHPDLAAKFQAVTGLDPLAIGAIRAWQRSHGLKADGKLGPETVSAAEAGAAQPAEQKQDASAAAGSAEEHKRPDAGNGASAAVGPHSAKAKGPAPGSAAPQSAPANEIGDEAQGGDVEGASLKVGEAESKEESPEAPASKGEKDQSERVPLAEAYALLTPVLATDLLPGSDDAATVVANAGRQLFDADGAIKPELLDRNPGAKRALAFLREPGASWQSNVDQTVSAFKALAQPLVQEATAAKRPPSGASPGGGRAADAKAEPATTIAGPSESADTSGTNADSAEATPTAARSVDAGKTASPAAKPKEADAGGLREASKIETVDPNAKPEKVDAEAKQDDEKPRDDKQDGLAAVVDTPTVTIESQVHVDEFFAKVPNNDHKKREYKALLDAHKSVARAEAGLQKAYSAAVKAAAEQKLAAAQKQLDSVKAEIVPMVAHALVNSSREVQDMEELLKTSRKALKELEHKKHKDKAKLAELTSEVDGLTSHLKELKETLYPQKLAEAQTMKHDDAGGESVLDPVATEVTHHDFAFPDKEHVKVRDRVAAYATTTPIGLDNESAGRDKQRPHSDVAGRMKDAGLSESKQKILGAISAFEGEFDTVNTYDRATVTWGFVQWAGGSDSDLTKAMTIIKEKYPDGFARAFQKYGIDVEGKNLIVTMPDGSGRLEGKEAAEAIMKNPKLGAAMAHAGRDPDVQKGEVKAAESLEIDEAMALSLRVGKDVVPADQIITSEYGAGLLANTFVHSGKPTATAQMNKAIESLIAEHPYVAGDAAWSEKAEKAIIERLAATDGDRATVLGKKLNKARGSYKP
jgi:hypothetical protein